jgi:hypothetical protein
MTSKEEIEKMVAESKKQREKDEKSARDVCDLHIARLQQKDFSLASFLDDLRKLNKKSFGIAVEFLIRATQSFWLLLEKEDLRLFVEFVVASNWYLSEDSFHHSSVTSFFESVQLNKNGISALSEIYKRYAKENFKLGEQIAYELAKSQAGCSEIIEALKIEDVGIQHALLAALVNRHIRPPAYQRRDETEKSYIEVVRSFIFNQDERLSEIATIALHEAEKLTASEIIKMMKRGDSWHIQLGIQALPYLELSKPELSEISSLVVKALEHQRAEASNSALQGINHLAKQSPKLISNEILDALIVRKSSYPKEFFNTTTVVSALRETFKFNPRLPGEVLHKLCEIAYSSNTDIRNRAVFVAIALNKKEFLALVNEKKESNPVAAKAILNTVTGTLEIEQIANQISQTDPKDVQQNAANQISVLSKYYESGLSQAKVSFNWAIGMIIFSILSFIIAVFLFINNTDKTGTLIAGVGGALTQLIANTLLSIYKQTHTQVNNYIQQMNRIQDYLLANSFIESLDGEEKQKARYELIKSISSNNTSMAKNKEA